MTHDHLKSFIDGAFDHASEISPDTKGVVRDAVEEVLNLLDKGELRVAEKVGGEWVVHQWLKKAILLSFRLHDPHKIEGGPFDLVRVVQAERQQDRFLQPLMDHPLAADLLGDPELALVEQVQHLLDRVAYHALGVG